MSSHVLDQHRRSMRQLVPAGRRCSRTRRLGLWDGLFVDEGRLAVPENRADVNSRLIELPFLRLRATNDHPAEPIFFLEGGPGMSNLRFRPPASLLANHDVVLVGYRGVDGSARLDCPEVSHALKGLGRDLLNPESLLAFGRAAARDAKRLQARGVDLAGYTILEVVGDLDAARAALGYDRIDLLSQSYGTRVAQVYAQLHPERVRRSAMIGVNPPGRFVWEPAKIDAQLRYYADLYRRVTCDVADLAQTMRNVLRRLPRRWLLLPIDPGKVRILTFALLFNRGTAARVFDAYRAAAAGDARGLALLSFAARFTLPSLFVWGDFFAKGLSADFDPTRDYATELDPPDAILGSPLSLLLFGGLAGHWPIRRSADEIRTVQPSEVETMLISGSVDFSTPADFAAAELVPHLRNGHQVVLKEFGHVLDVWKQQPAATERLLSRFFDTGVPDSSLFSYQPMNFDVRLGFPLVAKLLISLLPLPVLVLFALLIRWRRRTRDKHRVFQ